MLGLHYVPGDHGSMKRSSPWCFGQFMSSCLSSVKSCYVLSRSVKVSVADRNVLNPGDSTAHHGKAHGLPRMCVRSLPVCHGQLGPLTFCHVPIKFCHVYQVLPSSTTAKRGRRVVFEPVCAHGPNMHSLHCLMNVRTDTIMDLNDETDFVFGCLLGAYIRHLQSGVTSLQQQGRRRRRRARRPRSLWVQAWL